MLAEPKGKRGRTDSGWSDSNSPMHQVTACCLLLMLGCTGEGRLVRGCCRCHLAAMLSKDHNWYQVFMTTVQSHQVDMVYECAATSRTLGLLCRCSLT